MAESGGRRRQDPKARADDGRSLPGGSQDHAQTAPQKAGTADGCVLQGGAGLHHHRADG